MTNGRTGEIMEALKRHEISAFRSATVADFPGIALGMRATSAQRFVELLVPAPLDYDDALVRHMVGRGAELTADEEPWSWDGGLMVNDERFGPYGASALELRLTIGIPYDDLPEVLRRLEAK